MSERWVTFLLDGEKFVTTTTTIRRSDTLVMLAERSTDEVIRIDRSGKNFHHILQFLRDPNYKVTTDVASDLDFFRIPYTPDNVIDLEDKYNELKMQFNQLLQQGKSCEKCRRLIITESSGWCWECCEEGWSSNSSYVIVRDKGKTKCGNVIIGDEILNREGEYSTVIDILQKDLCDVNHNRYDIINFQMNDCHLIKMENHLGHCFTVETYH